MKIQQQFMNFSKVNNERIKDKYDIISEKSAMPLPKNGIAMNKLWLKLTISGVTRIYMISDGYTSVNTN